jgi:SAM-dependent methyltransferase
MDAKFGDGIDWSNEARRAAAEDAKNPGFGTGRSELVDRLAALMPDGGTVLDAGCNIGRYCPLFQRAGFAYTGVDQSDEALALGRIANPDGVFVRSLLWEMEFPEKFDAAVCFAVLQHNTHPEKERILPRIAAALRPGGIFVMNESTLPVHQTATQLAHFEWIDIVTKYGFELIETWHPNPEYGIDDAYAFRRLGEPAVAKPKARK